MPCRTNRTVSLASSPSPSRMRMVPSPYLLWRTRWPFFKLAAPVGSGISIDGRANAPALVALAFAPKKRAMLSMESGGAPVVSAPVPFEAESLLEEALLTLWVIHEANGLEEELVPPDSPAAAGRCASWLSSS